MAAQPTPAHPAIMEAQIETRVESTTGATTTTLESPLPPPLYTTPRLLIRPLHPQDAPSMAHHANNLAVAKYMSLGFPSPYTLDTAHGWINMNLAPPILNWAICLSSTPESVIGGVGLKPGADIQAHTAEVGFWVGEEFWGRGYASELLEGLTQWYFTGGMEGKWTRLSGHVFAGNGGSMRCFEKCGYVLEGILKGAVRKGDAVSNLHIFGLVKEDWEAKRKRQGQVG